MSKYDTTLVTDNVQNIEMFIEPGEEIIWKGKSKRFAFILNKTIRMAPIALFWLCIDGGMIATMIGAGAMGEMAFFVIPFFALHLMPVWIWLVNLIKANKLWKDSNYAVTDRKILIQSGATGMIVEQIPYNKIYCASVHTGIIDSMLGVGDVTFSCVNGKVVEMLDIVEYKGVYLRCDKLIGEQLSKPAGTPGVTESISGQKTYGTDFNPYNGV